jgi:hypothetical protein
VKIAPVPHSVLQVPVPELEQAVPHAHVTLLGPFAPKDEVTPGLLAELEALFADVTPFAFRLEDLSRFPGGTVYLSPRPSAPFRALTHELHRRFPEYPPYAGAFDDVVPHLSVAQDEDPEVVHRRLAAWLPLEARAREAALVWYDDPGPRALARFPFGTAAA